VAAPVDEQVEGGRQDETLEALRYYVQTIEVEHRVVDMRFLGASSTFVTGMVSAKKVETKDEQTLKSWTAGWLVCGLAAAGSFESGKAAERHWTRGNRDSAALTSGLGEVQRQ